VSWVKSVTVIIYGTTPAGGYDMRRLQAERTRRKRNEESSGLRPRGPWTPSRSLPVFPITIRASGVSCERADHSPLAVKSSRRYGDDGSEPSRETAEVKGFAQRESPRSSTRTIRRGGSWAPAQPAHSGEWGARNADLSCDSRHLSERGATGRA